MYDPTSPSIMSTADSCSSTTYYCCTCFSENQNLAHNVPKVTYGRTSLTAAIRNESSKCFSRHFLDDYWLEFTHLTGLAPPNRVNSATSNHQASKDVCSHLISAPKDEKIFGTAKHTQTTARAKAAIRTSKDSLHKQELKRSNQRHHANPTKLRQWNLPLWYGIQRCIACSILKKTT